MIKGKSLSRTVTYYREYSSQSSVVKEGMQFVVALDKNSLSIGGGQGVWTVLDDKVVGNGMNLEREEAIAVLKSLLNE